MTHPLCIMWAYPFMFYGATRVLPFGLDRVLPLSTLSDLWTDGHTFKKTWVKAK